ncbi:MAG TPA: hypothetical protein VKT77_17490 [Chthonomonadaceae bacterium]|nr:hypothetical protein [Chthonomonadaceae bacterium]
MAPFSAQTKMTCAMALSQVPIYDKDLTKMAKDYNAQQAKLKKSPKDAKVKKEYVDNAVKFEQRIYIGANKLKPAVKYRAALALCREVLKVDPKNEQCRKDMDQMVAIYKQMNRPVPQ